MNDEERLGKQFLRLVFQVKAAGLVNQAKILAVL